MSPPTTLYLGSKVEVVGDAINFNDASVDFSTSKIDLTKANVSYGSIAELTTEKARAQVAEQALSSKINDIQNSLSADESSIATVSSAITAINSLLSKHDKITLQNPATDEISNCIDGSNNYLNLVLLQKAAEVYSDELKNVDVFDVDNKPTKFLGWTVSGPNVPKNTVITSYRYDSTYTGYHSLYINTNNIIPFSGDNQSYTLTDLKVESFITLQNTVSDIKSKYATNDSVVNLQTTKANKSDVATEIATLKSDSISQSSRATQFLNGDIYFNRGMIRSRGFIEFGNYINMGTNHICGVGDANSDDQAPNLGQTKSLIAVANSRAVASEASLSSRVDTVNAAVATESSRAVASEASIKTSISSIQAALSADETLITNAANAINVLNADDAATLISITNMQAAITDLTATNATLKSQLDAMYQYFFKNDAAAGVPPKN